MWKLSMCCHISQNASTSRNRYRFFQVHQKGKWQECRRIEHGHKPAKPTGFRTKNIEIVQIGHRGIQTAKTRGKDTRKQIEMTTSRILIRAVIKARAHATMRVVFVACLVEWHSCVFVWRGMNVLLYLNSTPCRKPMASRPCYPRFLPITPFGDVDPCREGNFGGPLQRDRGGSCQARATLARKMN